MAQQSEEKLTFDSIHCSLFPLFDRRKVAERFVGWLVGWPYSVLANDLCTAEAAKLEVEFLGY